MLIIMFLYLVTCFSVVDSTYYYLLLKDFSFRNIFQRFSITLSFISSMKTKELSDETKNIAHDCRKITTVDSLDAHRD